MKKLNQIIKASVLTFLVGFMACAALAQTYDSLYKIERQIVNVKVNADGSSEEIEELTTLINSQLAIESRSQADIDYNSSFENVEVLEAYTILPDSRRVPVASNAIRTVEDDISNGASQFSDVKHKIIIFPNVSVGARTYYKVKTTVHTPLFPKNYIGRHIYSPAVEYGHAEYNFSHSPDIKINVESRDIQGGKIQPDKDGNIRYKFNFHQKNIKISEPQQVSYSDFAPAIYFSSFDNQVEFGNVYESRAADKSNVTPAVKKLAEEITKGITSPKEQAKALYNWVSREVRYVAVYVGAGGVVPHDADSVIKNRYGDCKDHNALLIALLKAKGIQASTAIINSGTAYTLPRLPVLAPMNHVITYLPTWDLYVDSTLEMAPFGTLSTSEFDKPVILTALGKLGRTPKMTSDNTKIITSVVMKVNPQGEIEGESTTKYLGVDELRARYKYADYVTVTEEKMVKNHFGNFRETGVGKFKPTDAYDLNRPFELSSRFKIDPLANVPGKGAIAVPVGLSSGDFMVIAYNKPKEKFNYPYVCQSGYIEENYKIEFPDNVKVTDIPNGINYSVVGAEYVSTYKQDGNTVTVTRKAKFERPSMVCKPTDLERWKDFHKAVRMDTKAQIFYQ